MTRRWRVFLCLIFPASGLTRRIPDFFFTHQSMLSNLYSAKPASMKSTDMLRGVTWLLLTLLSSASLSGWFLLQQYEEKSADFRILYRDITVKLSQHDAIMPLLSTQQNMAEVTHMLPQIVQWRHDSALTPRMPVIPEGEGQYWLSHGGLSLLIDLTVLLAGEEEKKTFQHFAISWQQARLYEQGDGNTSTWWRWDKTVVSPNQPFLLSAGGNPTWETLPWWWVGSPALFWALALYLLTQYQTNKRRRDIADLRAHYAELTRLNTLGELAGGMMHELNQPLTAIMSYNQAAVRLIEQNKLAQIPGLLNAAVVQIKRIDALLSQFRQRLASDDAADQPIVLPALWLRVCQLLDNEFRAGKVHLSSHFADDLSMLVAPPLWVEQILHNIASNAIQAQVGCAAAWLHFDVRHKDRGIVMTLTDGGPGLSEEALERVFMPFFTTRVAGIGLGMALVDTLVHRLNGTIEASNIAGQGACFRLWFPLREEAN